MNKKFEKNMLNIFKNSIRINFIIVKYIIFENAKFIDPIIEILTYNFQGSLNIIPSYRVWNV